MRTKMRILTNCLSFSERYPFLNLSVWEWGILYTDKVWQPYFFPKNNGIFSYSD